MEETAARFVGFPSTPPCPDKSIVQDKVWSNAEMIMKMDNRSTPGTVSSLSTTNLIGSGLGSNAGLGDDRMSNNRQRPSKVSDVAWLVFAAQCGVTHGWEAVVVGKVS